MSSGSDIEFRIGGDSSLLVQELDRASAEITTKLDTVAKTAGFAWGQAFETGKVSTFQAELGALLTTIKGVQASIASSASALRSTSLAGAKAISQETLATAALADGFRNAATAAGALGSTMSGLSVPVGNVPTEGFFSASGASGAGSAQSRDAARIAAEKERETAIKRQAAAYKQADDKLRQFSANAIRGVTAEAVARGELTSRIREEAAAAAAAADQVSRVHAPTGKVNDSGFFNVNAKEIDQIKGRKAATDSLNSAVAEHTANVKRDGVAAVAAAAQKAKNIRIMESVARGLAKQDAASRHLTNSTHKLTLADKKLTTAQRVVSDTAFQASRSIAIMEGPLGPIAGRLTALGSGVRALGLSTLAAGLTITGFITLLRQTVPAAIDLQRTMGVLSAATDDAAASFKLVVGEANRTGTDFAKLASSYAQLAAAGKGTSLQGRNIEKIFKAVNTASLALRLDVNQTRGSIKAIEQMISKGTVSSEELRQQLGERLPGAFRAAADAAGLTTAEFSRQLANGEILASDLLPKLADVLQERYGPAAEKAGKSLGVVLDKLSNSMRLLLANMVSQNQLGSLAQGINEVNDSVKAINSNLPALNAAFVALAGGAVVALVFALRRAVDIGKLSGFAFDKIATGIGAIPSKARATAEAVKGMGASVIGASLSVKTAQGRIDIANKLSTATWRSATLAVRGWGAAIGATLLGPVGWIALATKESSDVVFAYLKSASDKFRDEVRAGTSVVQNAIHTDVVAIKASLAEIELLKAKRKDVGGLFTSAVADKADREAIDRRIAVLKDRVKKFKSELAMLRSKSSVESGAFKLPATRLTAIDSLNKKVALESKPKSEGLTRDIKKQIDALTVARDRFNEQAGKSGNTAQLNADLKAKAALYQTYIDSLNKTLAQHTAFAAAQSELRVAKIKQQTERTTAISNNALLAQGSEAAIKAKKNMALEDELARSKRQIKKAELRSASHEEISALEALHKAKNKRIKAQAAKELAAAKQHDKVRKLQREATNKENKQQRAIFATEAGTLARLEAKQKLDRIKFVDRQELALIKAQGTAKALLRQQQIDDLKIFDKKQTEAGNSNKAADILKTASDTARHTASGVRASASKARTANLTAAIASVKNGDSPAAVTRRQLKEKAAAEEAAYAAARDARAVNLVAQYEALDEQGKSTAELMKSYNDAELEASRAHEEAKTQIMLDAATARNDQMSTLKSDFASLFLRDQQTNLASLTEGLSSFYEMGKSAFIQSEDDKKAYAQATNSERAKMDEQRIKDQVNFTKKGFGILSGLMESHNRKAFEVGKAAAVANATISGIEAVMKASTAAPFPFNVPLMAAMGGLAARNVSKILSTQFRGGTNKASTSASASAGSGNTRILKPTQFDPTFVQGTNRFKAVNNPARTPVNPARTPASPASILAGGSAAPSISVVQHINAPGATAGTAAQIQQAAAIGAQQAVAHVANDFQTNGPLRQTLAV